MQDSTNVKREDRDLQQKHLQILAAVHEPKLSNQPLRKAYELSNGGKKSPECCLIAFILTPWVQL